MSLRFTMGIFKRSTVGILFALISSLAKVHGYSQSRACARKGATILPRLHAQDPVSRLETEVIKTTAKTGSTVPGPPVDTKPDYANIIGPLGKRMDQVFLSVFRGKLAEQVGVDSSLPSTDFKAITDLAGAMNARFTNRLEIQRRAHAVLRALFPSWLPRSYAVLFSKPFPAFSSRMNAWATRITGTWLMGESEINDVEVDGGMMGKSQGLLVKRCRFLEESGCASVCVNSCKVPTQNFFMQDMGLPLTMEPNYETFECQFSFGKTPDPAGELEAKSTPCLSRCPTAGSLRKWHDGRPESIPKSSCQLMEDE